MTHLKKFEFTGEEITLNYGDEGVSVMKRIRALFDIKAHNVKAGDIGGYLEDESCLSHFGDAWVADSAMIHNSSVVSGDAIVQDSAILFLNCYLHGEIFVRDSAKLYRANIQGANISIGDVVTVEDCHLHGNSIHLMDAAVLKWVQTNRYLNGLEITENAQVLGTHEQNTVFMGEDIYIKDNAKLLNVPKVSGENVELKGHSLLDTASIDGENISIDDLCSITGRAIISSNVKLNDMVSVSSLYGSSFTDVTLSGDKSYYAESLAGA